MSEQDLARRRTESRVRGLFQMMKDGVLVERRNTMQILDGGGEAQRRERVQADAGQSWVLAPQATRKQGCQDVDSCRDGHVGTTATASPGAPAWFMQNFSETFLKPLDGAIIVPTGAGAEASIDAEDIAAVAATHLPTRKRTPARHTA
jgi:hypothetical protein